LRRESVLPGKILGKGKPRERPVAQEHHGQNLCHVSLLDHKKSEML
jgi:hypothetical protein